MDPRYYGHLTGPDAAAAVPVVLVVPVGSLEQHGPHLPIDTDTRIAVALVERVVQAIPNCWVGPAIGIGASGEHAGFAGTLSIGSKVLAEVVIEMVRTASADIAQVVLINGHGGNGEALAHAEAVCRQEGRPLVVWSPSIPDGDAHAGRTETSLMLAIAPELVRLDLAQAGANSSLRDLAPRLRSAGVLAVSPNGVLGDPTGASPAEGEAMLATLVADAVGAITAAVKVSSHD